MASMQVTKSSATSTIAKSPSTFPMPEGDDLVGSSLRTARADDEIRGFDRKRSRDWSDPSGKNWSERSSSRSRTKKAISIRVDEDVLDYFKKEGSGYQRRINAVLRSYMQQKRKKRA